MNSRDINERAEALRAQMSLEEKASLCSGADFWHTKRIERLGITPFMMSDGPHGLRQQREEVDHLGVHTSHPATCFPSASAVASSWDIEAMREMGKALGREARASGLALVLGPGINMKRSPLCGRNFEYLSEDPVLAGELATAYVQGLQSCGVGTSLKHFAANNQEHRRMSVNVVADERTLREYYLAAFERVVKKASPWTVMCAYNRLNGHYCAENRWLLSTVLRDEWGFDGVVVSDWGAVNDRVAGIDAGMDLEMPGGNDRDGLIVDAVRGGQLNEAALDRSVDRLLALWLKSQQDNAPLTVDEEAHHQLARQLAARSMVLLKNDDGVLPLNRQETLTIIGDLADKPRYQGGGSSHVTPTRTESLLQALNADGIDYRFARGYDIDSDVENTALVAEAQELARQGATLVLYLGLPDRYESEGYDREHLALPANQLALLDALHQKAARLVIVLANGAPVVMPWLDKASVVVESFLAGQASGAALKDILLGDVNPSGKLAETFPLRLEDTPAFDHYPSRHRPNPTDEELYGEGLLVGYRHYDTHAIPPLFPFGHGLSYTRFGYGVLSADKTTFAPGEELTLTIDITNEGERDGAEIVQLYLADRTGAISVAERQLRGFVKLSLAAGETATASFSLNERDFAYFDITTHQWCVPSGRFEILVGASSRDIRASLQIDVAEKPIRIDITRNTLFGDIARDEKRRRILSESLHELPVPPEMAAMCAGTSDDEMTNAMGRYLPLRGLVSFCAGFNESDLAVLIKRLQEA